MEKNFGGKFYVIFNLAGAKKMGSWNKEQKVEFYKKRESQIMKDLCYAKDFRINFIDKEKTKVFLIEDRYD